MDKIHYSEDMEKCPYCENDEFYIMQFDGKKT